MSLLSHLASSIFGHDVPAADAQGAQTQSAQSTLLASVVGLINHPEVGGISGLMQKFESAGLGHLMQGWISTGPNPPVSPDQLHQVLGSQRIAELAQKLGIPPGEVTNRLSALLPQVIDKLTPAGVVPPGDTLHT